MKPTQAWQGVPALIDRLIETADAPQRDRILLEAVACKPWVEAAALWRPGSDGPGFGARWHQVLARGPADCLPERDAIHSVVCGEHPADFYPGVRVLQAGEGRHSFALAVACRDVPDEESELLEALLMLFSVIDDGSTSERDAEPYLPLLPAGDTSRVEHDLRNLLTGIQATQELIACYGDELSAEELKHFAELMDTECSRAGDLLGRTFRAPQPRAAQGVCRPAELLDDLVSELEVEAGAELLLSLDHGTRSLESSIEHETLRDLLRGLLTEVRARCERLQVRCERDGDASLVLRLCGVGEGSGVDGEGENESRAELERHGLRLEGEGTQLCVRFPARRCA